MKNCGSGDGISTMKTRRMRRVQSSVTGVEDWSEWTDDEGEERV